MGSLAGSGLADSLGRRKAFLLDAAPMLAGPLISATATGLGGMIAGRVITGVGIGLSSALVPLFISEVGRYAMLCMLCALCVVASRPVEFTAPVCLCNMPAP